MSKDVVISTRIRLARNLNDYPFPCKLSDQGKDEVCNKVQTALKESNSFLIVWLRKYLFQQQMDK